MGRIPKISVIIPFYNRKKHIKECLYSVRQSTLRDIEIICVDDGSTDDTYDYLCRIATHDKRIIVIKADHKGPYEARWTGLISAKGEYIHFMDSDDIIEPYAYEECYKLCKCEKLDYIVFRCLPFTDEKHTDKEEETSISFAKHYTLSEKCCGKVESGKAIMHSLIDEKSFYVGLPMRIIRRTIIEEEDLEMCKAFYHADNFYSFLWLVRSKYAFVLNKVLYKRRVHRNSITMNKGVESTHIKSILQVIMAISRYIALDEDLEKKIGQNYLMRLARGLKRHIMNISDVEWCKIVDETLEVESKETKNLIKLLLIPLIKKI